MDIRKKTALITRNENGYIVGLSVVTGQIVYSISPWDAWSTRIRALAKTVADKTGSEIWLFNPVAGQLKRYEGR